MNHFKLPLLLVGTLAILGGLAYWDDHQTEKDTQKKEVEKKITDIDKSDVISLSITSKSEDKSQTLLLVKNQQTWTLEKPFVANADSSQVENLLDTVVGYKYQKRIEVKANKNLDAFGLDQPKTILQIKTPQRTLEFAVGNDTPVGYGIYFKSSKENDIFVGSQYLKTALIKTAFDFRDKSFFDLKLSDITTLTYQKIGSEKLVFKNSEDTWNLTSPRELRADKDELIDFISLLGRETAQKFIDNPTGDMKKMLASGNPATTNYVSLHFTKGSEKEEQSLIFFENNDNLFVIANNRPPIIKIRDSFKEKLDKTLFDFRYKNLFEFDSVNANKVTIDKLTFEKIEDNWYVSEEKESDSPLPMDHVRLLLVDLEFGKAVQILEKDDTRLPTTPPSNLVSIHLKDNVDPIEIEIWDQNDKAFLRNSQSELTYEIPKDLLTNLKRNGPKSKPSGS